MARTFYLKEHRSWEDWLGIGLGTLLIVSTWLMGGTSDPTVGLNAVAMGILVTMLAAMELFDRQYWDEAVELAVGAWTMVCPFIFGYFNSGLGYLHFAIGAAVVLLAVLELSQVHTPPTAA